MAVSELMRPVLAAAVAHAEVVQIYADTSIDSDVKRLLNTARRGALTAAWASVAETAAAAAAAQAEADEEWETFQTQGATLESFRAFQETFDPAEFADLGAAPELTGDYLLTTGQPVYDQARPGVDLKPVEIDLADTTARPTVLAAVRAYTLGLLSAYLPVASGEDEISVWDAWRLSGGTDDPGFEAWVPGHLAEEPPPPVPPTAVTIPAPTTVPLLPGGFDLIRGYAASGIEPGVVVLPPPRTADAVTGVRIQVTIPQPDILATDTGWDWQSTWLAHDDVQTFFGGHIYSRSTLFELGIAYTGFPRGLTAPPSDAELQTRAEDVIASGQVSDVVFNSRTADQLLECIIRFRHFDRVQDVATLPAGQPTAQGVRSDEVNVVTKQAVTLHGTAGFVVVGNSYRWYQRGGTIREIPPIVFWSTIPYDGTLNSYDMLTGASLFAWNAAATADVKAHWVNLVGESLPRQVAISASGDATPRTVRPQWMDRAGAYVIVAAMDGYTALNVRAVEQRPTAPRWTGTVALTETAPVNYITVPDAAALRGNVFDVTYETTATPPVTVRTVGLPALPQPFPTRVTVV